MNELFLNYVTSIADCGKFDSAPTFPGDQFTDNVTGDIRGYIISIVVHHNSKVQRMEVH